MNPSDDFTRRDVLKAAGLFAAGTGLWLGTFSGRHAAGQEQKSQPAASPIGRREILKGLDGMSRVAEGGNDSFTDGHGAAAVVSSAFFCRENNLDGGTQKAILSLMESRLLASPLYAPRADEPADPALVDGVVNDLDQGIDSLRRSGHNIIFAAISLRALREVPEAATPARVQGLRAMVRSFGTQKVPGIPVGKELKDSFVGLDDEKKFIRLVFAEYLAALDLYLHGRGHHGFAGHVLTVGHALLELRRLGHPETAHKGLEAYQQFLQQARNGADLGGRKVTDAPPKAPGPLERDYWVAQDRRAPGSIVSSHLIKYPFSFYALLKDLGDDALRQRVLDPLYHLTAVS